MKKATLIALLLFATATSFAATSPNEKRIYFHIHQATRWAELTFSKNCVFSKPEIEKHLGKIKYNEPRLVDSRFYQEYIFLSKVAFGGVKSDFNQIESFREKIHTKAEKLKIEHPSNWQNEFLVCSERI